MIQTKVNPMVSICSKWAKSCIDTLLNVGLTRPAYSLCPRTPSYISAFVFFLTAMRGQFVITYDLALDALMVHELQRRNSGRPGGLFLVKGRHRRPDKNNRCQRQGGWGIRLRICAYQGDKIHRKIRLRTCAYQCGKIHREIRLRICAYQCGKIHSIRRCLETRLL